MFFNGLAWSKLILNDYPVYGLAVYGLARGPGHRFHIKYFKLKALGPSFFQTAFTFRAQQIQIGLEFLSHPPQWRMGEVTALWS